MLLSSHLSSLPNPHRVLHLTGHHHTLEYRIHRCDHLPMLAYTRCLDQEHATCSLYRLGRLLGGLRYYQYPHRRGHLSSAHLDRRKAAATHQRSGRSDIRLHLGWLVSLPSSVNVHKLTSCQCHAHQYPARGRCQSIRGEQGRHHL